MDTKTLAQLLTVAMVTLSGTCSLAQSGNGIDNPDWVEDATPTPPALSKGPLIPLDMPSYVSIKVGVDPETIAVGADGVVRYVIVMTNATGNSNAVYEGIRCITDEVKTYARTSASGKWTMLENPAWKAVNDNMPSRHAMAFARQGGCQNHLATSKREIIDALKVLRRPTYQTSPIDSPQAGERGGTETGPPSGHQRVLTKLSLCTISDSAA